MVNSSDRWTPSFSVPQWYDAVASLSISFPRPRSLRRGLTGQPLSSPVCHHRIAPLVPTSVGWMTVAFCWGIKGKPSRSVVIAKSRLLSSSTVPPLLFSSPASFGQSATSPSLLSTPLLAEKAIPLSSSITSRRSSEDQEKKSSWCCRPWLNSWSRSSHFVGSL
jgi:hypothetical protein